MRIFPQPGAEKWRWGQGYLPKRGSGDDNGVKIDPRPVPMPARELISIPIPIRGGDFSPMRCGAPTGAGSPHPLSSLFLGTKRSR